MTVIVAEHTPDRIRGILKRWFLEPSPNIFVGNVNKKVCLNVLDYLKRESREWQAIVFVDSNNMQGFNILKIGETKYRAVKINGFHLIANQVPSE